MTAKEEMTLRRVRHIVQSNQFGCHGRHHGPGSPDCPRGLHHHHDELCEPPTSEEWSLAGRIGEIHWGSRT